MSNKIILPVRLDSYAGNTSALEVHFFKDSEEYGAKSLPDDSMWITTGYKELPACLRGTECNGKGL